MRNLILCVCAILSSSCYLYGQDFEFVFTADTVCIKNNGRSISASNDIMRIHLKMIDESFNKSTKLSLTDMMDFEKSIESRIIERTYTRGIAESLYPNVNHYILDPKPKEYERIECPYLRNELIYFNQKDSDSVKVLLFEWSEFSESGFIMEDGIGAKKRKRVFNRKFNALKNIISDIFGKPYKKDYYLLKSQDRFFDEIYWESDEGINITLSMFSWIDYFDMKLHLTIYKD